MADPIYNDQLSEEENAKLRKRIHTNLIKKPNVVVVPKPTPLYFNLGIAEHRKTATETKAETKPEVKREMSNTKTLADFEKLKDEAKQKEDARLRERNKREKREKWKVRIFGFIYIMAFLQLYLDIFRKIEFWLLVRLPGVFFAIGGALYYQLYSVNSFVWWRKLILTTLCIYIIKKIQMRSHSIKFEVSEILLKASMIVILLGVHIIQFQDFSVFGYIIATITRLFFVTHIYKFMFCYE